MFKGGLRFARSNAISLLALFVALGGTGYAASGGFTSHGKLQACVSRNGALTLLKSGKSCRHGQQKVAWNQSGPQGPAGPAGASGVAGLNGASGTGTTIPAKVASAETALTANNALALGGTPASQFTHRDCVSETGQIKGFMKVFRDFESPTFVPIAGAYNCSEKPVEAKRVAEGHYIVRFVGSPATIAIATTTTDTDQFETAASVGFLAPGEWSVLVFEGTKDVDEGFQLLVP